MQQSSYEDLDINEDYEFQQKTWRFQRIGWWSIGAALVLGLLGLFGTGMLSSAEVSEGNLRVKYNRFARFETSTKISLHYLPQPADTVVKIWLGRGYMDNVQIEQITPEPKESASAENRTEYTFRLARPGEPLEISCFLKTNTIGFLTAQIGVDNGTATEFTHFVYP